jgi:hypothetical protein
VKPHLSTLSIQEQSAIAKTCGDEDCLVRRSRNRLPQYFGDDDFQVDQWKMKCRWTEMSCTRSPQLKKSKPTYSLPSILTSIPQVPYYVAVSVDGVLRLRPSWGFEMRIAVVDQTANGLAIS